MAETIDPRIEARRAEVRHLAGRKWRWAAGSVAGLVVVSVTAVAVSRSPLMGVRRVVLHGAPSSLLPQVSSAGQLERGRPLAEIGVVSAASRIEKLPWVASATVHRSWPQTVVVDVVPRAPVAAVAEPGRLYATVDRTGRVLSTPVPARPALPLLTGQLSPGAAGTWLDPSGRAAASVAAALPPQLASQVTYIYARQVLSPPSGAASGASGSVPEVVLRLNGGTLVEMGAATSVHAKVVALGTLLRDVPLARVKTIDLKVPEAPTLTAG